MLKNKFLNTGIIALLLLIFSGCEPYDPFIKDFDYSAVYFGSQKPLRTLVTREGNETLDFKLGVVLAGLRENTVDQWVTFELDTTLLDSIAGASAFTLLPEDWYSFGISDNKIIIPKGKFLGDFTISIDKSKFTADPLSLTKNYALPLRIVEASVDSVLRGDDVVAPKDYTILVVRYINEYSGTYYVRGEQVELDASGNVVANSKVEYYHVDWIKNKTRSFGTKSLLQCEMQGLGNLTSDKVLVDFGSNNAVTLSNPLLFITDLGSTFNQGLYHFKYTYVRTGKTYQVDEFLKQRNDPESDLRFEEW